MDVTSLYTNIPQEEGVQTVCRAYSSFHNDQPPIPTRFLKRALRLILQENSFQFCGREITYKHTELPWAQKWQSLSPIFLWAKLKQNSLVVAHSNRSFGSSCHPPGVKRGFIKGEALRLLRTNSAKATFEKIKHFESRLIERGYAKNLVQRTLSEVIFENRKQALQQKPHTNKRILPFVTQYHPSGTNLKEILMENWHLIERQPLLREFYKFHTKEEGPLKIYS